MVGHKKWVDSADEEADQLTAFMKNVEVADTIRETHQGNFVAIYGQEVVGYDPEYRSLLNSVVRYLGEKELYVGYIPKNEEVLVV